MKPTKVQRELLAFLVMGEEIEEDCYDFGGPCVGAHRHFPWRTFSILKDRQWIRGTGSAYGERGYWTITEAGKRALAGVVPPAAGQQGDVNGGT